MYVKPYQTGLSKSDIAYYDKNSVYALQVQREGLPVLTAAPPLPIKLTTQCLWLEHHLHPRPSCGKKMIWNASVLNATPMNVVTVAVNDTAIVGGLLAILVIVLTWSNKKASKGIRRIPTLRGPPVFGHWRFFTDRYAFVNEGLKKLGSVFQFQVLNVRP